MRVEPVIAVLDLWSLGHSAGEIARMLGFSSHKQVARIVATARKINDPRAVLHQSKTGRLMGRPGRMASPPPFEVVESLRAQVCRSGHRQGIPRYSYPSGSCRECRRLRWQRDRT